MNPEELAVWINGPETQDIRAQDVLADLDEVHLALDVFIGALEVLTYARR